VNTPISALVGGGTWSARCHRLGLGCRLVVSTSGNRPRPGLGSRATGNTVAVKGNNINTAGL
jgi:hypothetical protein